MLEYLFASYRKLCKSGYHETQIGEYAYIKKDGNYGNNYGKYL